MSRRGGPGTDRPNAAYLFWRSIVAPVWRAFWNARNDLAYDADGRAHRIVESGRDAEVVARIRRVREHLYRQGPEPAGVSVIRVALILGVAPLTGFAAVRSLVGPNARAIGVLLLIGASSLLYGAWIYIRQKRTLLRWWPIEQVRDAWVAEGGCPACGYSLPTENASEGIVVCTECGTRWRRSTPRLTP